MTRAKSGAPAPDPRDPETEGGPLPEVKLTPEVAAEMARRWETLNEHEQWVVLQQAVADFSPDEMHAYILAAGGDRAVAEAARAGRQHVLNERAVAQVDRYGAGYDQGQKDAVASAQRAAQDAIDRATAEAKPTTVGFEVRYTVEGVDATPDQFWAALVHVRRGLPPRGDVRLPVLKADAATALLDFYEASDAEWGHMADCPQFTGDTSLSCACGWAAAKEHLDRYDAAVVELAKLELTRG